VSNLPTRRGVVTADTLRRGINEPAGRKARVHREPQPLPDQLPDTVTTKQLARLAGTSLSCVQKWVAAGELTARRVGSGRGRLEFDGAEALEFLRKRAGGGR
jgi:excisionase family DNA binding protein